MVRGRLCPFLGPLSCTALGMGEAHSVGPGCQSISKGDGCCHCLKTSRTESTRKGVKESLTPCCSSGRWPSAVGCSRRSQLGKKAAGEAEATPLHHSKCPALQCGLTASPPEQTRRSGARHRRCCREPRTDEPAEHQACPQPWGHSHTPVRWAPPLLHLGVQPSHSHG